MATSQHSHRRKESRSIKGNGWTAKNFDSARQPKVFEMLWKVIERNKRNEFHILKLRIKEAYANKKERSECKIYNGRYIEISFLNKFNPEIWITETI